MKQEIIERTMKDCEMCHHPIIDQYYLTVGDFMAVHQNCLRCATCSRLIDDEQKKCFYRERKFYCATPDCSCFIGHHDFDAVSSASSTNNDDYYHISDLSSSSSSSSSSSISSSIRQQRQQSFWSSCHKCLRPIEQNQYFIRLNQKLYHMECFRCSKCLCRIDPGSPYGLLDDILCENHYYETTRNDRKPQQQQLVTDKTSKNQSDLNNNISTINNHQSETTTINANKNNGTTNPISTSSVIRPLKIDSSNLQQQTTSRFQNETLSIAKTSTTSGSSSRKKKRVRTSFKHQQLRMMKAHFLLNQNPDSKELKELSEKTGLQKRVLQVWFQNSRAKQRKCSSALPSPSTSGSFIDCTRNSVGQQSLNGAVTPMTTMSHHMFSHPQRHHLLLQHPTIASSVGHSQQHQQHLPSSVGDEDEDDDDDNSEESDSDDDMTTLDMDEQPSDSTATSEYYFDFV